MGKILEITYWVMLAFSMFLLLVVSVRLKRREEKIISLNNELENDRSLRKNSGFVVLPGGDMYLVVKKESLMRQFYNSAEYGRIFKSGYINFTPFLLLDP